jgi:hypothetical protein
MIIGLKNVICEQIILPGRHVDDRRQLLSFELVQMREASPVVEVTLRNVITIKKISLARLCNVRRSLRNFILMNFKRPCNWKNNSLEEKYFIFMHSLLQQEYLFFNI